MSKYVENDSGNHVRYDKFYHLIHEYINGQSHFHGGHRGGARNKHGSIFGDKFEPVGNLAQSAIGKSCWGGEFSMSINFGG